MKHKWTAATLTFHYFFAVSGKYYISFPEAKEIQNKLRLKLLLRPGPSQINVIAGADISFNRFTKPVFAGIILLSFPALKTIGHSLIKTEVNFPYVPGYRLL